MDAEFELFLFKRGIAEEIIKDLRQEKIDVSVISLMDDVQLSNWFTSYGDRLAIKNYCKQMTPLSSQKKKRSVLDRLRKKMNLKSDSRFYKTKDSDSDDEKITLKKGKYNSEKDTRQIEIGWINGNKQVRTKQGGGTRKISILKSAEKPQILQIAKDLFFPAGQSTKGPASNFKFDLYDFKSKSVPDGTKLADMFFKTGFVTLRFYLHSREIIPSAYLYIADNSSINEGLETKEKMSDTCPQTTKVNSDINSRSLGTMEKNSSACPQAVVSPDISKEGFGIRASSVYDDSLFWHFLNHEENSMATQTAATLDDDSTHVILWLHRGNVMDELISAMTDLSKYCKPLQFHMIGPNGQEELAVDTGGVYRDILSEFWDTFYERCTEGSSLKVPCLRHDFGSDQWHSVAKILYKGWVEQRYFPIKINPIFIEYCVTGGVLSDIKTYFFEYINRLDADILKNAITDFDSVDSNELFDIFDNLESKWQPNKDNILDLISALAHKELIQKPMFIIKCFMEEIKGMITVSELHKMYEKLKPTAKNIICILTYNDDNDHRKSNVIGYLKKFIKETDEKGRSLFLRFCTGSNILTASYIQVSFDNKEGFLRAPSAHTCNNELVLSCKYENYPDFRSELNSVLNSNIWVMDIL